MYQEKQLSIYGSRPQNSDWQRAPVFRASSTEPEVSLVVMMSSPKAPFAERDRPRISLPVRRAMSYVDSIIIEIQGNIIPVTRRPALRQALDDQVL
ncbi:hypothetical protein BDV10DRAFT_158211 [Aspergillus recurvatus]